MCDILVIRHQIFADMPLGAHQLQDCHAQRAAEPLLRSVGKLSRHSHNTDVS
jgi:hypothetical protein